MKSTLHGLTFLLCEDQNYKMMYLHTHTYTATQIIKSLKAFGFNQHIPKQYYHRLNKRAKSIVVTIKQQTILRGEIVLQCLE